MEGSDRWWLIGGGCWERVGLQKIGGREIETREITAAACPTVVCVLSRSLCLLHIQHFLSFTKASLLMKMTTSIKEEEERHDFDAYALSRFKEKDGRGRKRKDRNSTLAPAKQHSEYSTNTTTARSREMRYLKLCDPEQLALHRAKNRLRNIKYEALKKLRQTDMYKTASSEEKVWLEEKTSAAEVAEENKRPNSGILRHPLVFISL